MTRPISAVGELATHGGPPNPSTQPWSSGMPRKSNLSKSWPCCARGMHRTQTTPRAAGLEQADDGGTKLNCSCMGSFQGHKPPHQTYPMVKLIDLFHFRSSYPNEANLSAMKAPWDVLSWNNFRFWLKRIEFGKKISRKLSFDVPPFFKEIYFYGPAYFSAVKSSQKGPQRYLGLLPCPHGLPSAVNCFAFNVKH